MTNYDAIIVGSRCAGSPTAMLLARRGYRVLLVDRASFPSDTLSTHYLHQPGVASLARWGLLDEVARSGCPPIRQQTLDFGPFALRAAPTPAGDVADGYCVRRTVLDDILVRAAADAGAEVRQGFSVTGLVTENGRVTGIRGNGGSGEVTERARIVIGADGLNSRVARTVDAPVYRAHPTMTCAYYTYYDGIEITDAELYPRPGRSVIAAPTNDGLTLVIAYWPAAEFHAVRADIERHFLASLDLAPRLAERVRHATRAERFRGTGNLPNQFRRSHGDGWALVGDAGYHKDPILALGITDAFRDAQLLADALDAGFSGRKSLDAALAGRERRRDQLAAQGYETTLQFATLEPPPPDMQQLVGALLHNPEQASRFLGTIVGTVSAAEFFAPENMASIFAPTEPMPV